MKLKNLVLKLANKKDLNALSIVLAKKEYSKKTKKNLLRNSDLLTVYKKLLKEKTIRRNKKLEELLQIRKIRSLSGVAPVAVLTKAWPCPGECIYCPTQKGIPKSYLSDEPAVMRAQICNFDPYKQVKLRLKQYEMTGHIPQKVELIIMGGTFSSLPTNYQISFITQCFQACNQKAKNPKATIESLKTQQKINEQAKYRIVGLTLETRPDQINKKEVAFMRQLGATRVELGVQSIYNHILKKVKRGHDVEQTVKATQLLKDAGFKVCYHLMPNLPGSNLEKDLKMFKTVFSDQRFMPDMIKIYPCVVTPQSKLFGWFKKGKFQPYTDKQLINLLIKIKKTVPSFVRINRLYRDIPAHHIAAGSRLSNIRQVLEKEMTRKKAACQCIRCREARNLKLKEKKLKLEIINYKASGGEEYFLQYVDQQNRLYALLRLRFPSYLFSKDRHFLPTLQNAAIIRELHTFGQALAIGEKSKKLQHKGLGRKLLKKAQELVKQRNFDKIAVISGVGVRNYYQRLGYTLKNQYMIKYLR